MNNTRTTVIGLCPNCKGLVTARVENRRHYNFLKVDNHGCYAVAPRWEDGEYVARTYTSDDLPDW